MRHYFSRFLLSISLLYMGINVVQAQTPEPPSGDCKIDLSLVIANLADAQVSATSGDRPAALEMIAQVQADLQEIETNCTETALSVELSQTYRAPGDLFTFAYPQDWFIDAFQEGLDWESLLPRGVADTQPIPRGGSILISSEPITASRAVSTDATVISISVGNPLHILQATGLHRPEASTQFIEEGFTLKTLSEEFFLQGQAYDENRIITMNEVTAQRPTVAFHMSDEQMNAYIVIVALNEAENQYAVVVGVAPAKDEAGQTRQLVRAIAETITIPQ